ncbi:aminoglycoside adenylyltransferase domain-containing protein [Aquipuribacter nitratireducens]|uniref:Aminoglycoside adenylyltransferase domain-containing protein n=1 Tax=Aquipuribacter nitratireducens TaxID=650104 RepID=A0ABW0GQ13_9MICO
MSDTESNSLRSIPGDVRTLLTTTVDLLSEGLGPALAGVYLHGSLAVGDFCQGRSDVDLLAVLTQQPDEELLVRLRVVHDTVDARFPMWRSRVEVEYVALDTLQRQATDDDLAAPGVIARVSPGEHLHLLAATQHRVLGWSLAHRHGVTLTGPPVQTVIPAIDDEQARDSLLHHVRDWPTWVRGMTTPGGQAYAVLSVCRAAVALDAGDQVSKKVAATIIAEAVPAHRDVVLWARDWWYQGGSDDEPPRTAAVRRFVDETSTQLLH